MPAGSLTSAFALWSFTNHALKMSTISVPNIIVCSITQKRLIELLEEENPQLRGEIKQLYLPLEASFPVTYTVKRNWCCSSWCLFLDNSRCLKVSFYWDITLVLAWRGDTYAYHLCCPPWCPPLAAFSRASGNISLPEGPFVFFLPHRYSL